MEKLSQGRFICYTWELLGTWENTSRVGQCAPLVCTLQAGEARPSLVEERAHH
jgi:hypothetical protein